MYQRRSLRSVVALVAIFSFHPAPGWAHPGGAAVSLGSNPVVSASGTLALTGDSQLLFAATEGSDLIISDIYLSSHTLSLDCRSSTLIQLKGSDGRVIGSFSVSRGYYTDHGGASGPKKVEAQFTAGLHVPAGLSVTIETSTGWSNGACSGLVFPFTVAGYYTQP